MNEISTPIPPATTETKKPEEKKLNRRSRTIKRAIFTLLLGLSLSFGADSEANNSKPIDQTSPSNPATLVEDSSESSGETEQQQEHEHEQIPGPSNLAIIDVSADFDYTQKTAELMDQLDLQMTENISDQVDAERLLTDDSYAVNYLLQRTFNMYSEHGEAMGAIIAESSDAQDQESSSEFFALQNAITQIEFRRDEFNNPILSVFIDPDVVQSMISQTDMSVINISFQVGWGEITAEVARNRIPDHLSEYTVNGETVFSENEYLSIEVDTETDLEVLMKKIATTVDITSMSDQEKLNFLTTQVISWSPEEVDFLIDQGFIDDSYRTADNEDWDIEGYYFNNFIPLGEAQQNLPTRNTGNPNEFFVETMTEASFFTQEQADEIRENGISEQLSSPNMILTEPYDPNQESAIENVKALIDIAMANPDQVIVASAGNVGSNLPQIVADNQLTLPDNLIIVSGLRRNSTVPGSFYVRGEYNSSPAAAIVSAGLATFSQDNPTLNILDIEMDEVFEITEREVFDENDLDAEEPVRTDLIITETK